MSQIILHEQKESRDGTFLLRTACVRFSRLDDYETAYGEPILSLPTRRVYVLPEGLQLVVAFDDAEEEWNPSDVEDLVRLVRRYGRAEVQQIVEAV